MKTYRYFRFVTWVMGLAALTTGCAQSQFAEQVADLERKVTRLRAEKAQLSARNAELDDQLARWEVGREKSGRNNHDKNLRVVKLGPAGSDEKRPEPPQIEAPATPSRFVDTNEKRPLLTLRERPARKRRSFVRASHTGDSSFGGVDGDNLGVVKGRGQAPVAEPQGAEDPMEQFKTAYRLYSNKKYDDAIEAFGSFLTANPTHGYADNALYWKGESLFAKGKIFKAIGEFERILMRYPRSDKAASAAYRIGFSYDQMHDKVKAKEYYFKVVERYPGTDAARRASQRVAVLDDGRDGKQSLMNTSAKR